MVLLRRIEILLRRQHARQRSQRQIELLGRGRAECQADGVGSVAGVAEVRVRCRAARDEVCDRIRLQRLPSIPKGNILLSNEASY